MNNNSENSDSEEHPLTWNDCIETMYDLCADVAHPRNRKYHKLEEFYDMLRAMDAFLRSLQNN